MPAALNEINTIMDAQHDVKTPGVRDYFTQAMIVQLERVNKFITLLTLFTAGITGDLAIRRRPGHREYHAQHSRRTNQRDRRTKAIGARDSAIMKQFLTESTLLSGLGGLAGVAFGLGLTLFGSWLAPRVAPDDGPPEISWYAIGIAFGASLRIGLLSGGFPALRASRMQPIEAPRP